ncbi:alpha/beta fold hydrolase [Thioalkalivibrio sp. HK1]|uniref:alpha/beta fold hydrolase n=1 Tax=Thioalkalivibrio sp. HK1 TaxID=1469245 RepID=UPI00046FD203|nr:alpha/beta hydrolase [Thioalkalivibrio sp. HK1]
MNIEIDGASTFLYTGSRAHETRLPTVFFVHGAGLDHSVWIHQSRYFAHHDFNVAAIDLPGHGRSRGKALPDIVDMAKWILRAADALGCERFFIAGHSMGSLVALEVAGTAPDRIEAAALVGCAVPMAVSDSLLEAAKNNHHDAIDMISRWGHRKAARIGGNPSPGMWMTGTAERLLERAEPGVLHNDLDACNEYRHGLQSAAKTTCPVHLILGEEDVMAPAKGARALIDSLPAAHVTELADCGHMLMAERPDAVRDALLSAFRKCL